MVKNHEQPLALFHGQFHRLLQPLTGPSHCQLVHHHFDVVVLIAVHLHATAYLHDFPVNAHGEVSLAPHLLEEFAVVAFAASYQWCQNVDPLTGIVVLNHFKHPLLGIFHHWLARHIAVCFAGTGEEQAQIVVNLRGGAHGGAGVPVGGFLLDADDRRQAGNLVHVGTLHAA